MLGSYLCKDSKISKLSDSALSKESLSQHTLIHMYLYTNVSVVVTCQPHCYDNCN